MHGQIYRYEFSKRVEFEEVSASLTLALFAVESLHGETLVELSGAYAVDERLRRCVIDTSSRVGDNLNRIFLGFLRREFASHSFQVERIGEPVATVAEAA